MNSVFASVSKEAEYIESHVDNILHPDLYLKLLSFIAGGIKNVGASEVLEQSLLSYNSDLDDTTLFLQTYVPLALIYTVLSKPSQKKPVTIAFNEKIMVSAFKSLCDKDIESELQAKNVTLKDYTLVDYVNSNGYISDTKLLYDLLVGTPADTDDLSEDMKKYYKNFIENAVEFILQVYTDIFSSGYEVIQPYGVLTPFGALRINASNEVEVTPSLELCEVFGVFNKHLHYQVYEGRDFDTQLIDNVSMTGDGGIPYVPRKMLEYALGRENKYNSPSENVYPVDSNATTWVKYRDKSIKYGLTKAILKMAQNTLGKHNLLHGEDENKIPLYMSADAVKIVRDLCERAKVALTGCMLVSEWKVVDSRVVGLKVRVVDIQNRVPLSTQVIDDIVSQAFNGNKPEDAVVEVPTKRGKYVKEFAIKFDARLCEAEPLFALKALDSMQRRGIPASWDNLILGKYEDDTILSASSPYLNLKTNLCHFIIAGSRSGKGVMTLNILASGIASGRPLFYLDRKPDMASLLKDLSGGKMFVINGSDHQAKYDPKGLFTESALTGWDKNIPDEILKICGGKRTSYKSMADLFYLRALFFVLAIIDIRCNNMGSPEIYNKLGGDKGIILVVDELSNTLSGLDNYISETGSFFTNYVGEKLLRKQAEKITKALEKSPATAEKISDVEVYSTAYVNCLSENLKTITSRMNAGWKGNANVQNDIFILGQNIKNYKDKEITTYEWTKTAGVASGQDSYMIQNMFIGMSADGFFGYNQNKSTYLNASTAGSKASTKLTSSARNFAYIPNLSFAELKNVTSGDKVTGENAIYFKPCLILNDHEESSTPVQEFKDFCVSNKISYEDVKAMNSDGHGNFDPRIGFAEYIKSQSPDVNIQEVLGQSYEIGNYVVQQMGYDGDCLEFIFDLRPEWLLSIDEMSERFAGHRVPCEAYKLMKEYAPHLVGVDSEVSEEDAQEYAERSAEVGDLFNEKEPEMPAEPDALQQEVATDSTLEPDFTGEEGDITDTTQFDNEGIADFTSDDPLSVGSPVSFDLEAFSQGAENAECETDILSEPAGDLGTNEAYNLQTGIEPSMTPPVVPPMESPVESSTVSPTESQFPTSGVSSKDAEIESLRSEIEFLKNALQEFKNQEFQRKIVEATDKIMKEETQQDAVLSEPFKCRCFGEVKNLSKFTPKLNIVPDFEITEDVKSVKTVINSLTNTLLENISIELGGLDRITDMMVMSEVLVFNNVCYSPQLPMDLVNKLPLDVRQSVASGRLAWIFLFSALTKMTNLTTLMFDSSDFVYKKVRIDLGYGQNFIPRDIFKSVPSLMDLQIEGAVFDRDSVNDAFEDARASTRICNSIDSWGISKAKSNWQSMKNVYRDPTKGAVWKTAGVAGHLGMSAVGGVASLGAKMSRFAGSVGRKMMVGARAVRDAMNEQK